MKTGTLLILFIASSYCLTSQHTLYIYGGLLHANKGALLHVEGEIENMDTSSLENDGVIELTGDFTNAATASFKNGSDSTSTERACKFIGASTQAIKGDFSSTTSRYMYNMIVDKSVSGTAVELQTPVSVKGSLVFGSATTGADTYTPTAVSTTTNNAGKGIIKTYDSGNNDYELFVTNSSANAIKGYAALAINGNPADGFIKNRGAQGEGAGGLARNVSATDIAYVFPVGSGTNGYNAVSLTFTTLGANPHKIRTMFVDADGGVGTLNNYCNGCDVAAHDSIGFNYYFSSNACDNNNPSWVVLDKLPPDHGYWSFTGHAADQYSIETFPNSFSDFEGDENSTWRMIKKSGAIKTVPSGDWTDQISTSVSSTSDLLTYTKNAGCYSGNGVPGGIFTGFSHFQMARTGTGNALPVELIYLTAEPVENKLIRLYWATALEINNRGFEILRSTNGTDFEKIGWTDGNDNSTVELNYSFDDFTVLSNVVYYYRLKQIDYDGASEETYLVAAQLIADNALNISPCFPNPATTVSHFNIQTSAAVKLLFELYDITGQLIQRKEINAPTGNSQYTFSTNELLQGSYKVVIKSVEHVFVNSLHIIQ